MKTTERFDKAEVWKSVEEFPLYQISSHGRLMNRFGLVMKTNVSNSGYERIYLQSMGVGKNFSIHRLVAVAFVFKPEGKTDVNHKDGDKLNNYAENLEWVTKSENTKHSFVMGLQTVKKTMLGRKGADNPFSKKVYQYKDGAFINEFASVRICSSELDIPESCIARVCRGERYTSGGFTFSYTKLDGITPEDHYKNKFREHPALAL